MKKDCVYFVFRATWGSVRSVKWVCRLAAIHGKKLQKCRDGKRLSLFFQDLLHHAKWVCRGGCTGEEGGAEHKGSHEYIINKVCVILICAFYFTGGRGVWGIPIVPL